MNAVLAFAYATGASTGFFTTLVEGFEPKERFALTLVLLGVTAGVVLIVSCVSVAAWNDVRKRESDNELKRDLLDQGKSAEEIERLLHPSDGYARALESWGRRRKR